MAIKHFNNYFYTMLNQYCEEKENLKDFEEAFKAGYITEDKLTSIKDDFERLEANFERVKYLKFLLDMPNRDSKKSRYEKQHKDDISRFKAAKATLADVELENNQLSQTINEKIDMLLKTK